MKNNWKEFVLSYFHDEASGLSLDLSHMDITSTAVQEFQPKWIKAHKAMNELEKGSIANPDENRMVGHYWLRNPELAPDSDISSAISSTLSGIKEFANSILSGSVIGENGPFKNILLIGIGGSALGPQLVDKALTTTQTQGLSTFYFDNTDPDGMNIILHQIGRQNLGSTLVLVISKSGGTKETRNGMLAAENAWTQAGLNFNKHAVAITSDGSLLHKYATDNNWITTFPMWDWVGGRTSVMSAVGLLPAALQGHNIDDFLAGAAHADSLTRQPNWSDNPAAQLATAWYCATQGTGAKAMVILPYKDRLDLFSKYLQQLVMESLGKELDLDGQVVNQGITVYGNKGSTDQHAYVQQLRDGVNNFFATFIEILKSEDAKSTEVEPAVFTGDYLAGFLQGTRTALSENNRQSLTITVPELDARSLGLLIALYERAVGYYASFVNINAYHQPGVEAGKKAAGQVILVMQSVESFLKSNPNDMFHVEQLAEALNMQGDEETLFRVLIHLAANRPSIQSSGNGKPDSTRFGYHT